MHSCSVFLNLSQYSKKHDVCNTIVSFGVYRCCICNLFAVFSCFQSE